MDKGIKIIKKVTTLVLVMTMTLSVLMNGYIGKAASSSSDKIEIYGRTFPDTYIRTTMREFDENKDTYLDQNEISKIKVLDCKRGEITDLKGIEYLWNLEELYLGEKSDGCTFTTVDLTNNPNLRVLEIWNNDKIPSIDVSKYTKLERLVVSKCPNITAIDISKNKNLTHFNCYTCSIKDIDVSNNTKLKELCCGGNLFTSIDVSKNPNLEVLSCNWSGLTQLDVSKNTKLKELACWYNNLTSIDISNNLELELIDVSDNPLTEIDISKHTKLKELQVYDTNIKVINPVSCPDVYIRGGAKIKKIKKSVKSIELNKTTVSLEKDKTTQLTATVLPADADMNGLKWETNNAKVAVVDANGVVTALAPGNATITATAEDMSGVTASCMVTVPSKGTGSGNTDYTGGSTSNVTDSKNVPNINAYYRTHIQTYGWEGKENDISTWKSNGAMSGTSGKSKRLEGINIVVDCADPKITPNLGIQYTTHCQSYGWLPWSGNGEMNGTERESKRLEAIMIKLTGADAQYYDVYYRVHAQTYGWLGWAKNGAPAGTAGYAKRLEGIQVVVVKKGESFNQKMEGIASAKNEAFVAKAGDSPIVNYEPTNNTNPVVPGADSVNVAYRTHVQSYGWQAWKYNGQMSGTSGKSKRLEGINIELRNQKYSGDIVYTTHVQKYGWQGSETDQSKWFKNGQMAGTSGEAKRLEAICINLTGDMSAKYDIYYRVHAQSYGWLGWAKNGAPAGTAGYAKRLEGIQIVLVPKGGANPGNYQGITSVRTEAYVKK